MATEAAIKRAREVVDKTYNQLFGSGLDAVKIKHELAAALTEARLEEAKWWANGSGNGVGLRSQNDYKEHWAELEQHKEE
jgi:hypothetical protein